MFAILLSIVAITVGFAAFSEQLCPTKWFVSDDYLCKDCSLYLGNKCEVCFNETVCDTCTTGYVFAANGTNAYTAL